MSSLMAQYELAKDKFVVLTQRERALTLLAALAVVLMLGFVAVIEPELKTLEKESSQFVKQNSRLQAIEEQLQVLQNDLAQDPDAPLNARLDKIQAQINALDSDLSAKTRDLIPADKMPHLLQQVFAQTQGVNIVTMSSIPPTVMLVLGQEETKSDANLYQHGVKLTLQGQYFDILKTLESVESLPFQFFWKQFNYAVSEYPMADVDLEIYTLSTSQAFIGVPYGE